MMLEEWMNLSPRRICWCGNREDNASHERMQACKQYLIQKILEMFLRQLLLGVDDLVQVAGHVLLDNVDFLVHGHVWPEHLVQEDNLADAL